MSVKTRFVSTVVLAAVVAAAIGSVAAADTSSDTPSAGQTEMQLPPGWTMEDMQAVTAAATPGKMHEKLSQDVGDWRGKTTMWMYPDAEPTTSECTSVVTPMMDGRYYKIEMNGEMPGMGPFSGFGISGFDNVSKKFVSTWIDNQGTGILCGTGELSPDGKTLTWNFKYNCPITKGPVALREVDTFTGPDTRKLEMFGQDPKSGQEFKMMQIELTRE